MRGLNARNNALFVGASALAIAAFPGAAAAQDAATTAGQPGDSETQSVATEADDDIVVTGIRAS